MFVWMCACMPEWWMATLNVETTTKLHIIHLVAIVATSSPIKLCILLICCFSIYWFCLFCNHALSFLELTHLLQDISGVFILQLCNNLALSISYLRFKRLRELHQLKLNVRCVLCSSYYVSLEEYYLSWNVADSISVELFAHHKELSLQEESMSWPD